jgi:hypothetical protein
MSSAQPAAGILLVNTVSFLAFFSFNLGERI